MELRLGGVFQADYRYYAEEQRADNRFDISKARLRLGGHLAPYLSLAMEYEFQGNETDNLVEAYAEADLGFSSLRLGQFKEPFGLEWQSADKAQFFAQRCMGYYLGPGRDIGLMLHGSWLKDAVTANLGLFNGDGEDGSASGPEADSPEAAARVTFSPFMNSASPWMKGIHFGASATHAEIDPLNVDLRVKSTGMAGTDRNLYVLTHNTKFGVIQDAGSRQRIGAEAALTLGPVLFQAEYMTLTYTDLKAAGGSPSDADFSSWYVAAMGCLTGETPALSKGIVRPIIPNRNFDPRAGAWGALCLSIRLEHFSGDADWINPDSFVSVKEADACSVALTWVLLPVARAMLDYTHTDLSDPIRVRVQPDGSADYIEAENVVTCRFSIDF